MYNGPIIHEWFYRNAIDALEKKIKVVGTLSLLHM